MTRWYADKRFWFGTGLSIFVLILLFRKINTALLLAAFRDIRYEYVAGAVLVTYVSYFLRAVRWQYLLIPIKPVPLGSLFEATIIGYMANNLLPARLGELIRAFRLGQREKIAKSTVFATLVLDRLLDGFTVLLFLIGVLFLMKLPAGKEHVHEALVTGGYVTLLLYLGVIGFLLLLKKNADLTITMMKKCCAWFPQRFTERLATLLESFVAGIALPAGKRNAAALALSSLVIWICAVWPVDLVCRAFGLHMPLAASVFILVLLVFAVMVPASPGYVGTYHAACVYGLMAFDIQKEKALSIAIIIHATNFIPVIALGGYFLWRNRLSLRELETDT